VCVLWTEAFDLQANIAQAFPASPTNSIKIYLCGTRLKAKKRNAVSRICWDITRQTDYDLMYGSRRTRYGKFEEQSRSCLPLFYTRLNIRFSITLSPVYPAAASLLGSERGLSIRFPRFMKLRDDKTFEQATTSDQFAEMYRHQIKEAPARETKVPGEVLVRRGSEEAEAEGDVGDGDEELEDVDSAEGDNDDEE
jgi:hypothetical protein